jgi:hypothetical protein
MSESPSVVRAIATPLGSNNVVAMALTTDGHCAFTGFGWGHGSPRPTPRFRAAVLEQGAGGTHPIAWENVRPCRVRRRTCTCSHRTTQDAKRMYAR